MGKGGGGGSTPSLVDDNLKNKQFLNIIDLCQKVLLKDRLAECRDSC